MLLCVGHVVRQGEVGELIRHVAGGRDFQTHDLVCSLRVPPLVHARLWVGLHVGRISRTNQGLWVGAGPKDGVLSVRRTVRPVHEGTDRCLFETDVDLLGLRQPAAAKSERSCEAERGQMQLPKTLQDDGARRRRVNGSNMEPAGGEQGGLENEVRCACVLIWVRCWVRKTSLLCRDRIFPRPRRRETGGMPQFGALPAGRHQSIITPKRVSTAPIGFPIAMLPDAFPANSSPTAL